MWWRKDVQRIPIISAIFVGSLIAIPTVCMALGSSPVFCSERLRTQGITNEFELHEQCKVCFANPSDPICQEPDRSNSGSRSSRRESSSDRSSNNRNSFFFDGRNRESSDVGQGVPDVERCLIKERRGEGVWFRNQCHSQDIQVMNVCANEGLEPLNLPDTLLLSGGSSDIKFCKRSR